MQHAVDALRSYSQQQPSHVPPPRLRILALTDGEDTQSSVADDSILQQLRQHNIVVDSVVLGRVRSYTHASEAVA